MTFLREIRLAFRALRRQPTATWTAIAVMALGIGAVTAVFSVLKGVLLTPLPYPEAARLALLRADLQGYAHQPLLTNIEYYALRDRRELFDSVAAMVESTGNLTAPGEMAPLTAAAISDNFLDTLGIAPLLGGSVSSREPRGVVISYGLWQRHFDGDPNIVGRQIEINDARRPIVGVLPASFKLYIGPGVRVPPHVDVFYYRGRGYDDDPFRGNIVIARLRRDIRASAASAAVDTLGGSLVVTHAARYPGGTVRLSLHTLDREVARAIRPALLAVGGAVAFVLLAACVNLTNLLVARVAGRSRELAIRASIGASRLDLAKQFIAEALVIGACGAAAGLALAHWAVQVLLRLAPSTLPRRDEIVLDASVAAFAVAASLVAALAVHMLPLIHAIRMDVAARLKQDALTWQNARLTRGLLVAGQLALSLVLLAGFALVARAFVNLRSVPLGFEPDRAATMQLSLHSERFNQGTLDQARQSRLRFYQQLRESVRGVSGVEQFGAGFPSPMSDVSMVQPFLVEPGTPERTADGVIALAGFLEALGVPLVEGRYFTTDDDNRPVIIVDESLAKELWPGQTAIGRQLHMITISGILPREIVGVVRHVQMQGVRDAGMPQIWVTYATRTYSQLNAVVRATNPVGAVSLVEREAQRLGSGRPVRDARTLSDAVATASADTRFAVFVLGVFGGLALLLAAIGVYGAAANGLVRRTREIAVRIALGAEPQRIFRLAVGETAAWTTAGLCAGLAGAWVVTRYLGALLFEVEPTDPVTFAAAAAVLAATALAAAAIPALRAARVDPTLAMRAE
jgi:putative ABC transport system permease protein